MEFRFFRRLLLWCNNHYLLGDVRTHTSEFEYVHLCSKLYYCITLHTTEKREQQKLRPKWELVFINACKTCENWQKREKDILFSEWSSA